MNDFDYVRRTYGVPAKRGGRVSFEGRQGSIVSASGGYIRVRFDGENRRCNLHPTWHVTYLATPTHQGAESPETPQGSDDNQGGA